MAKYEIPLRPKGRRYKLTANEQDCLTWYVLSNCKREDAYRIFVRPDLAVSKPNLRTVSSQFFSAMEVREYLEAYRATLEGTTVEGESGDRTEKRTATAVQMFTDKVVDKMMGDLETVDEMDAVAKLADRVGVLEDKDKVEEAPRRYLPERCSACSYKNFVESSVQNGSVENECDHCKTRKFAEANGWKYDVTNNLEV